MSPMIDVVTLQYTITSKFALDFGANRGSSIHGMLYEGLSLIGALDTIQPKTANENDPRPFSVRPPLHGHQTVSTFAVSYYGDAGRSIIPIITSAIRAMQALGIGRVRDKFTLTKIDYIHPIAQWESVAINMDTHQVPMPVSFEEYIQCANALKQSGVSIQFLTPTRLIENGRLCKVPMFEVVMQRLFERITALNRLYGDKQPSNYQEFYSAMSGVSMSKNQCRWDDSWSHSTRDGMYKPTGGIIGKVTYFGDVGQFLPFLLFGQGIQVGKNTAKGQGWYRLNYEWK